MKPTDSRKFILTSYDQNDKKISEIEVDLKDEIRTIKRCECLMDMSLEDCIQNDIKNKVCSKIRSAIIKMLKQEGCK